MKVMKKASKVKAKPSPKKVAGKPAPKAEAKASGKAGADSKKRPAAAGGGASRQDLTC